MVRKWTREEPGNCQLPRGGDSPALRAPWALEGGRGRSHFSAVLCDSHSVLGEHGSHRLVRKGWVDRTGSGVLHHSCSQNKLIVGKALGLGGSYSHVN